MQFSFIWPIDRTLSSATTLGEIGPGSNGYEGVLCIFQRSSITGISPSNCLVSYQDTHLACFTLLQRCSWCILQSQPTGSLVGRVLPLCIGVIGVFYSPSRLDNLVSFSFSFLSLLFIFPVYFSFVSNFLCISSPLILFPVYSLYLMSPLFILHISFLYLLLLLYLLFSHDTLCLLFRLCVVFGRIQSLWGSMAYQPL